MRSRSEMIAALKNRIKQLEEAIKVLDDSDSPYSAKIRDETVLEELQTFLNWSEDKPGDDTR